ncbi:EIF2B4 family protein [Megaselia abdita]
MKTVTPATNSGEKSREQIKAEREAKKAAKQAKTKSKEVVPPLEPKPTEVVAPKTVETVKEDTETVDKSREQIKAEREAKKLAKQASKSKGKAEPPQVEKVVESMATVSLSESDDKKKPTLSKAERRAIQEAQRAAKAAKAAPIKPTVTKAKPSPLKEKSLSPVKSEAKKVPRDCKIKLFSHLEYTKGNPNILLNGTLHPAIIQLGEQYSKRTIVGSNARYFAFLNAIKKVIQDYETPPNKEFSRSLEVAIKATVDHLHKCRPLPVSVMNGHKYVKYLITQLDESKPENELKEELCNDLEIYIDNQICKAAQAISKYIKIVDGDVILTFGCSSLIDYILKHAQSEGKVNFRVIVVDSRPFLEGQELLRKLVSYNINCTYVLINAVSFIMPEVTKVLLGAHALLSNGYVMARTGTAQVALVARSFNVPVLVCCETHKFTERFQTDAIVYNELGNPDDLVVSHTCKLSNWQSQHKLVPLNLNYDITPPELVTAVVTEVAVLPCTSVPVILRYRPTEIGY